MLGISGPYPPKTDGRLEFVADRDIVRPEVNIGAAWRDTQLSCGDTSALLMARPYHGPCGLIGYDSAVVAELVDAQR